MAEIDLRYSDKRTIDRYIRLGLVDEKAWERYLKSLDDVAAKAAPVDSTLLDEDEDEDEGED